MDRTIIVIIIIIIFIIIIIITTIDANRIGTSKQDKPIRESLGWVASIREQQQQQQQQRPRRRRRRRRQGSGWSRVVLERKRSEGVQEALTCLSVSRLQAFSLHCGSHLGSSTGSSEAASCPFFLSLT